jgi:hypothetical protein
MGAKLHLLMLLRWEAPSQKGAGLTETEPKKLQSREEAESVLRHLISELEASDLETVGAIRQGDPSSELLKYLAEHQPFQAVVWGGNEAYIGRKRTPLRTHWLERVREQLDCTLVVPSRKRAKAETG